MTTSPASLERKVRQLDNDVTSIYERLSAIQGTQMRHGNRFDELDDKMTSVEGKVDGLDKRLGSVEGKVDGLDKRLGSVEGKVDGLDKRLGSVEGKVDGLVTTVNGLSEGMQNVLELLRDR